MIRLLISPWGRFVAGLFVVLVLLVWLDRSAYNRGYAAAEFKQAAITRMVQERLDAVVAVTAKQSADLENYRDAQRILVMGLEDEIRADPAAVNRVPSPDSLRRLKRRWGIKD
jgi:hypothetical protein